MSEQQARLPSAVAMVRILGLDEASVQRVHVYITTGWRRRPLVEVWTADGACRYYRLTSEQLRTLTDDLM